MPYNTTAIPPRKEVTGQTQLPRKSSHPHALHTHSDHPPVTRVKKIIAVDPDVNICSNNAAFVITIATVRLPPPTHHPRTPNSPSPSPRNSSSNTS